METLSDFQRLTRRASDDGINLNDRVYRDESFSSLSGRNAIIYQGTMDPEGTRVAIKSLHLSPSADKAAGEVHALHCYNIHSSD